MTVTIRDVARSAGVSAMTVSRVINDQPRVKAETRRRVEAAIAALGYVPNGIARGLSRRATKTISVIVPDIANPFFTLVVRGAEDVAWRAGYHLVLCNTQTDLGRERRHLEDALGFQVAGVLIAPVSDRSATQLRTLRRSLTPFVLIDRSLPGFDGDLVRGDSVAGARLLVEHLIGFGHRRIAMITEPDDVSTARDRVRGYREALEAAGIEFRAELVAESSAIHPQIARDAALRLLDGPAPPTAIFALNTISASGVSEAARERGLSIPDDVGLVCFDDIELGSRIDPFLTVLAQPAETFGRIAMQLLLERLGGLEERGRTVVLPGELVVRRSAAPLRAETERARSAGAALPGQQPGSHPR